MGKTSDSHLLNRIERLNAIGKALSAEQDINLLLEMILLGAKELTNADGGSLYIIEGQKLNFSLIHTTSLGMHMGGTSSQPITFAPISLYEEDGRSNQKMVVTRAATEGRIINIPDAYADKEYDFSGTRMFDSRTGYRSQSLLAVPMQDHEGKIIGVLQLINAIDPVSGDVHSFSAMDESLTSSLASQAAIALARKNLIDGLEQLLQSLVKLIASAIDDKSPHTGGHCRRVPPITMALAKAVNEDLSGHFRNVWFSDQELVELEMAAWLHDCGKITTPEYVVDKRTRLETIFDRVELIETRLELLRRDAEIEQLKTQLASCEASTLVTDAVYQEKITKIDEIQAFIRSCNSAGYVDDDKRKKIQELSSLTFSMVNVKEPRPILSENEIYNLSIQKGTLTAEERQIINSHIDASIRMLGSLPFPEHLQKIPEIAGGHHERIDGKGYPHGVPAAELSLQSRILAVADVFEALTASDRVYREPNTLSESLKIMGFMCKEGHLDPKLLSLFISSKAYLDYAQKHLLPTQIDAIDEQMVMSIYR